MQNAYNRDDFITINWDNVLPSEKENFVKYFDVSHFGETYDYTSVMHYGTLPRGDKLTIEPLVSGIDDRKSMKIFQNSDLN